MKIFFQVLIVSAILLQLCGCSGSMYSTKAGLVERADLYGSEQMVLTESLFREDQAVISNQTIDQILSSRIIIPEKSKLSILRFEYNYRWSFWSEELLRSDQQSMDQFIGKIRKSRRLTEAL